MIRKVYFLCGSFLCFFWIFWIFWTFCILCSVTKATTKSYQGYYRTPKMALNSTKQHNKDFFLPEGQKKSSAKGRSPLQELEVGPRSRLYLLVLIICCFGSRGLPLSICTCWELCDLYTLHSYIAAQYFPIQGKVRSESFSNIDQG